jgi:hypothetical protein
MDEEGGDGLSPWRVLPRLVGGAVTVPVVVGFVALGAAVLVFRSVREVVRETWALVPAWRHVPQLPAPSDGAEIGQHRDSDAA